MRQRSTASWRATATNAFLAHGPGGDYAGAARTGFAQDVSPFDDGAVVRLEAHQAPGGLDQGGAQPRVALFSHAALQGGLAAAVFARTEEAGVTGALTPVLMSR